MISIGPDITDAHTIRETLYLNSIPRVWNLLEGILESYPNI
jgi:di/tripeptidase